MTFNREMLSNIFKFSQDTPMSMGEKTGICRVRLARHVRSGNPSVDVLVGICNAYHYDIHRFFCSQGETPERNKILVCDEDWKPIVFHPERIQGYSKKAAFIKCDDLAALADAEENDIKKILEHPVDESASRSTAYRTSNNDGGEKYVYFGKLTRMLPSLLHVSQLQLGIEAGSTQSLYRSATRKDDIQVRTLVKLCNAYGIDINAFFPLESEMDVPDQLTGEHSVQQFHNYRISEFYGKGKPYTYNSFKEFIGYTSPRMVRTLSNNAPMTATELARLCNLLHVAPSYFFEDPATHAEHMDENQVNAQMRSMKNEMTRLAKEKRTLESRIRHLEAMLKIKM